MTMPSLSHFQRLAGHLALAGLIGGMLALGALTAPQVFHTLPLETAGPLMSSIFKRYDTVIWVCIGLLVFAESPRWLVTLRTRGTHWPRTVLGLGLITTLLVLLLAIHPVLFRLQAAGIHRTDTTPEAHQFDAMHHQSERLFKLSLLLSLGLLVNWTLWPSHCNKKAEPN